MKRVLPLLLLLGWPGEAGAGQAPAGLRLPCMARRPERDQEPLRKLTALPSQDTEDPANLQVDVHSADLSGLDLRARARDLSYADFDSRTIWPRLLPKSFRPQLVTRLGKNPGLGLRELHRRGITGKGVGIGVIDAWSLLVDHVEYRDRVRFYEELPPNEKQASLHFCAVVSAAAGRNVGVAPEADLYVVGVGPHFKQAAPAGARQRPDLTNIAGAIDRLVALNRCLPRERRIRVIAVPMGWPEVNEYTEMVFPAVERAKREGIFVLSCSVDDTYREEKISFNETIGMGRSPLADPDLPSSYGPCYYSEKEFARAGLPSLQRLLLPMDSRTYASGTGPRDYVFLRHGGSSWVAPYAAGLFALCCQAKPQVTPAEFWKTAMETGDCIEVERRGAKHPFGTIVNPVRLLDHLIAEQKRAR